MKNEKARYLRDELVLDALLLTDALGVASVTLPKAKYEQFIREGEVLAEDFVRIARGKGTIAVAYALTLFLTSYGRSFEKHKREAPRVVVPTPEDMGFGRPS